MRPPALRRQPIVRIPLCPRPSLFPVGSPTIDKSRSGVQSIGFLAPRLSVSSPTTKSSPIRLSLPGQVAGRHDHGRHDAFGVAGAPAVDVFAVLGGDGRPGTVSICVQKMTFGLPRRGEEISAAPLDLLLADVESPRCGGRRPENRPGPLRSPWRREYSRALLSIQKDPFMSLARRRTGRHVSAGLIASMAAEVVEDLDLVLVRDVLDRLDDLGRNPGDDDSGRNVFDDDGPGGHDAPLPDPHAFQDDGVGADQDVVPDDDGLSARRLEHARDHRARADMADSGRRSPWRPGRRSCRSSSWPRLRRRC